MDAVVYAIASAVSLVAAIICATNAWRLRATTEYRMARWSRTGAALLSFLGCLLAIPGIDRAAAHTTGIDNIATLGTHLAVIGFCAGVQMMIVDWSYEQPYLFTGALMRLTVAASVAAALIWQFAKANTGTVVFATTDAEHPNVVVYLLTLLAFKAYAGTEIAVFCIGMARSARRGGHTRTACGQMLAGLGGAACVAQAVSRCGYLIAYQTDDPWPLSVEHDLSSPLTGLYIVLVLAGLCLSMRVGRRTETAVSTA